MDYLTFDSKSLKKNSPHTDADTKDTAQQTRRTSKVITTAKPVEVCMYDVVASLTFMNTVTVKNLLISFRMNPGAHAHGDTVPRLLYERRCHGHHRLVAGVREVQMVH